MCVAKLSHVGKSTVFPSAVIPGIECENEGYAMRSSYVVLLSMSIIFPALSSGARSQNSQVTNVGPWEIATSYKADKFDACMMSRTTAGLGVSFARVKDGLLLLLDSPKWKLDRGKTYSVRLVAGSQSVDAKALAETKGVTITLADRPFNGRLRTANFLEVRGEGATLKAPLDGSSAAFERLEACFEKNSRESTETNPFVAPDRKP